MFGLEIRLSLASMVAQALVHFLKCAVVFFRHLEARDFMNSDKQPGESFAVGRQGFIIRRRLLHGECWSCFGEFVGEY